MLLRFVKRNYFVPICLVLCAISLVVDYHSSGYLELFSRSGALIVLSAAFAEIDILRLKSLSSDMQNSHLRTELFYKNAKLLQLIRDIYKYIGAKPDMADYEDPETRIATSIKFNEARSENIKSLEQYEKFDSTVAIGLIILGTLIWAYGDLVFKLI